jgi:prolycopene isomerase
VVDRLIQDRDLRKILKIAAIFPRASMVMLSWFWEIIAGVDCYYPKGGVQRIADTLAENFKQIGGEILYRRKAVQILTEKGRAGGVKLSDGTLIRARAVVSNADARQTFLKMLNDDESGLPRKYLKQIDRWRLSESFFYVYLGVDLDMKAGGLSGSPILWYFPEKAGKPSLPDYIGMSVPSLSDEGLAPSGMHTVVIGAFADGISERWFGEGGVDPGEYQRWKEEIVGSLIRLAGEAIPDLEGHIVVREAASPLTFHRYTGNSMGASSGWSMDAKEQNKLPQKTPLPNLFLAGHWTFNPGGMPAAFMTGRRAAELVRRAL